LENVVAYKVSNFQISIYIILLQNKNVVSVIIKYNIYYIKKIFSSTKIAQLFQCKIFAIFQVTISLILYKKILKFIWQHFSITLKLWDTIL